MASKQLLFSLLWPLSLLVTLVIFTACNKSSDHSPTINRALAGVAAWLQVGQLAGQPTYSPAVEAQIKLVENSLSGRVKIEGHETHNLLDRMAYYKVHGVSIALIDDYQVVWARGYGWADAQEKRPVTDKTVFQVASISKSINSMGVLKLAQDKKIDLDADINQYLTSWKFPYDHVSKGKKVTPMNLLTHSAGINNGGPMYRKQDTIPSLIAILNGAHPTPPIGFAAPVRSVMEPDLVSEYSNLGIGIAQLMVTDVTGQPYEKYIAETVFQPLGMHNSSYNAPLVHGQQQFLATGYNQQEEVQGKNIVIPIIAAGGLWTTPTDLGKFIIELQLAYKGKSQKVLSKEMATKMLTPYLGNLYAPGMFLRQPTVGGEKYFEHSGAMPGFNTQFFGSLEDGNGVVVLVNSGGSMPLIEEIVNSVATVYDWRDFYSPIYKKAVPVADSILQKYTGLYMAVEDRFTMIVQKEDGYYLYVDGTYDKMYFTNETDFFNAQFPTEKHFLTDAAGNVTGYTRTLNGVPQPALVKILHPATLTGSEDFFGVAGWTFLENKNYSGAIQYLERGLDLYPNSLMMEMNLAHSYLFNHNYAAALQIYKAHLSETVRADTKWPDMIRSDFTFFKRNQFDHSLMDRVLADLNL